MRTVLYIGLLVVLAVGCERKQGNPPVAKAEPAQAPVQSPSEIRNKFVEDTDKFVEDMVAEKPGDIRPVSRIMMFLELSHVKMTNGKIQEGEKKLSVLTISLLKLKIDAINTFDATDRKKIIQKMAEVLIDSKIESAVKSAASWTERENEKK